MKSKKPNPTAPATVAASGSITWRWLAAIIAGLILLFWAYAPAMHAAFVFDDTKQQYALPTAADPLAGWIGPVRPILMFSYWANVQLSRDDTFSFHVVNLLIHGITALLVFFVIRRLLEWAGTAPADRTPFAAFGAMLFLLHPLQTESVDYIAGRSELVSGFFFFAGWLVFFSPP